MTIQKMEILFVADENFLNVANFDIKLEHTILMHELLNFPVIVLHFIVEPLKTVCWTYSKKRPGKTVI